MSTIKFENWDTPPAGTMPVGWNVQTPLGDIPITTTTSGVTPISSPNVIVAPNNSLSGATQTATWDTADGNSGNVQVQGAVQFVGGVNEVAGSVFARCNVSSCDYTSSTFYELCVSGSDGQIEINKYISGTKTSLAAVATSSLAVGVWYQLTLKLSGTSIEASVQRLSDGWYFSWMTGNFFNGVAVRDSTDASISGQGYAGYGLFTQGVQPVYADDWTLSTYSAPQPANPGSPVFPDRAPAAARTANPAYLQQLSGAEPLPPGPMPSAGPFYPAQAPGAARAGNAAYVFPVLQAQADPVQPPGDINFQDRISWPGRTGSTGRAPITEYRYVSPGPAQITPPTITPSIFPYFPDRAPGPSRAGGNAYVGLLAANEIADARMPAARPWMPDMARAAARASTTAYVGLLSTPNPTGNVAAGKQVFPDRANAAARATVVVYAIATHPEPADRNMPPAPSFPVLAPGARRASADAYQPPQPLHTNPAPATSGHPVFPDQVRSAPRSVPRNYDGLLSAHPVADGRMPAGWPQFPERATASARAQQTAYVVYARLAGPDSQMPATPSYPQRAPGFSRTSPDAYRGRLSGPVLADGKTPATPFYSLPQRSAARAPADAYQGLLSRPSIADARMPAARPYFPERALAAARAPVATYQITNKIATTQIYVLSASTGIRFTAYVGDGPIHILSVSAGINLSASPGEVNNRYRYGDLVPFVFAAPPGTMLTPNPTLTVTQNGTAVASFPLWTWDGGITFQADVLLTQVFALGRLIGSTVLLTTSGAYQLQQVLDLVAGGDVGSTVISVYAHEGVSGRATLAQLRSGELVQGSDPWMDS